MQSWLDDICSNRDYSLTFRINYWTALNLKIVQHYFKNGVELYVGCVGSVKDPGDVNTFSVKKFVESQLR